MKEKYYKISLTKKLKVIKSGLIPYLTNRVCMAHLWVTRRCNIHCKFCYVRDYSKKDPSLKELKIRLDKLKELGCRIVVIMGGEPTLRKDLLKIVKYCKSLGLLSYLVTNGTKISRKLIDNLGKAGLDAISLSLDTLNLKENNLVNYNKYSYSPNKRLDLLKYAEKKYDMIVFIAICITKLNYKEVPAIIKFASGKRLFVTLTMMINPYRLFRIQDRSWKNEKNRLSFGLNDSGDVRKLISQLKSMKKQGYRILEPDAYFDRIINSSKKGDCGLCDAGIHFFDIDTDGKIMLCVASEPLNIYYHELTKRNLKQKLNLISKKQLNKCKKSCFLAAYYDTSYYIRHPIELIKTLEKIY